MGKNKGGAPKGNRNAIKHGAYATVSLQSLSQSDRDYVDNLGADIKANLLATLQSLRAREISLTHKLQALQEASDGELHVERVVDAQGKETTVTTTSVPTFEQVQKLDEVLSKVQGQILKTLASIQAYDNDKRKNELAERQHNLYRQKLSGVFEFDDSTGLIDDTVKPKQ